MNDSVDWAMFALALSISFLITALGLSALIVAVRIAA